MNKLRKNIIERNEISQLCQFTLGGYSQKVLIEGKSKDNPIVITLHGGPGTPIPFSVGCRGMFPEFTDKFIMVYWDQLGCGINNYKISDSFNIDTFTNMTADLITEIRRKFPNNRIFLFATSWGSVLSAKVLKFKEEELSGVIVSGQIVKDIFFNDETMKALDNSNIPKKKLTSIKRTNVREATSKELQLISKSLTKYTSAYTNKRGKKAPMFLMIKGLIASPDYSIKDFKAIMLNGYQGNNSIWNELLKIDLTETLSGVDIPYIILQGDTDVVAPTQMVKSLVDKSENSNLQCIIVRDTGHFPGIEMMEVILRELEKLTTNVENNIKKK